MADPLRRQGEVAGHPATATKHSDPAFSLLVEVDAFGLDLRTMVSDVEALGAAVHLIEGTEHVRMVVSVGSSDALERVVEELRSYFGLRLRRCEDRVLAVHRGGKIRTVATVALNNSDDLALLYTPGAGRVALEVADHPGAAARLTAKANTVAIVTDGSAVLGLGDLGPLGALPVMEGKAALFDRLAGINAVPLCLDVASASDIVSAVRAVAPSFGGINLEDISAPRCFGVEQTLDRELDIPVFHDDQHGTAIVVVAALLNALRIVGKAVADVRVVVSGAGAAGTAVTEALVGLGIRDVTVWVPTGILCAGMTGVPQHKMDLALRTNPRLLTGGLRDALAGADVFVGVSGPNLLTARDIETMAARPIVFGLANPTPEFDPIEAACVAAVVATGRSDFPNQINNVLAFPGIFRGALDVGATTITPGMKRSAARALSTLGRRDMDRDRLLPDVLDPDVVPIVASAVGHAWMEEAR